MNITFQRRKTGNKPRDASTAAGDTAAESVRNLIKKNPKYSKRINYDALKDLFVDSGNLPSTHINMVIGGEDKGDEDMFIMDAEKSDGEDLRMPTMIVEEEPGTVMVKPLSELNDRNEVENLALAEDMYDDGSDEDKEGDFTQWEEAYEQEV